MRTILHGWIWNCLKRSCAVSASSVLSLKTRLSNMTVTATLHKTCMLTVTWYKYTLQKQKTRMWSYIKTLELTPLKSGRFRASPSAHWPWASEKRQGGSSRSHWPNWTNSCAPTQIESSGESVGLCYPQVLGPLGRLFHSSVAEALDEPREVRSPWTQPKGPSALLGT